jgi:hypothetical protein
MCGAEIAWIMKKGVDEVVEEVVEVVEEVC